MSKKLIAVASAAAIALSALVGVAPASAAVGIELNDTVRTSPGVSTTTTLRPLTPVSEGLTEIAALTKMVPFKDVLKYDETIDATSTTDLSRDNSLIRVVVEVPSTNTTVTAITTGGVKVIDGFVYSGILKATDSATGTSLLAKDGKTTYSESTVAAGVLVEFYVFTTSTAAGTVVISYPGTSATYYIKGLAGTAYNLTVDAPTDAATTGDGSGLTVTVSDVFKNQISNLTHNNFAISTIGAGSSFTDQATSPAVILNATAQTGTTNYSSTAKAWKYNVKAASAGSFGLTVNLYSGTTGTTAITAISGLDKPVVSFFKTLNGTSFADQVTALTSQVTALQAQLALSRLIENSVSQDKYNTLARKWNKANPRAKVALKK
jgi:hypothetical protein